MVRMFMSAIKFSVYQKYKIRIKVRYIDINGGAIQFTSITMSVKIDLM